MSTKTIQHVFSSSGELFTAIHIQSQQQTLERGEWRKTNTPNLGGSVSRIVVETGAEAGLEMGFVFA
jgi:hypothetical protein